MWKMDNLDPFASASYPGSVFLLSLQQDLVRWKIGRETRQLRLEGTRWRDPFKGAELEFGEDGIFRWLNLPSPPSSAIPSHSNPYPQAARMNGARYRFHPDRDLLVWNDDQGSMSRCGSNLEFPGEAWQGFLGYDGQGFRVEILFDENAGLIGEGTLSLRLEPLAAP